MPGDSRPPPGAQLAPLGLPADDPVVGAVRRLVRERRTVRAAFLYRRAAPSDELRPAVGLLPRGRSITPAEAEVVRAAIGEIHGQPVEVVAVDEIGLPAVLAVAAPIGAGGDLEEASVDVLRRRGRSRLADLRLAATFATAIVHVPAAGRSAGVEAGALRRGEHLTLPRLQLGEQPVVPAFSSELALLHTAPPHPGAVRMPGSVLAAAVPDGIELALDPGCPAAAVIATVAVRSLTGRHPVREED